jgi:uncharacterized membrane protein (DUF485 family)
MSQDNRRPVDRLPLWISVWFVLDAIVALAPPLYWAVDGKTTPILGLPTGIFYFVAVGIFVGTSIIAAYWAEAAAGEFDR